MAKRQKKEVVEPVEPVEPVVSTEVATGGPTAEEIAAAEVGPVEPEVITVEEKRKRIDADREVWAPRLDGWLVDRTWDPEWGLDPAGKLDGAEQLAPGHIADEYGVRINEAIFADVAFILFPFLE